MTQTLLVEQHLSDLYDRDFNLWLVMTVELLRQGRLAELDVANLLEEIETMGRSEKSALKSNLVVVLWHLLKWKYQPEKRSTSWELTIAEHRRRLRDAFEDSPSLKRYFHQYFEQCYQDARRQAKIETQLAIATFPETSPFTPEQSLDQDFLP
ncbi:DUF29 domain-containing protein [Pseudanabaena mucicola]|uniref:DUF29 domain-containing protein n=1 Tax=Pseudanabaena mucicola FACHB-723 TaxID=2692860 RepID=A0ABR7ZYV9_9CYAN|nr:DUF29 domain-containing protein [Pseudanabaena mucicola]MBD2188969.1 DUF29 domain-containing protein [Pseudanabaena mucicola FACHB-723]